MKSLQCLNFCSLLILVSVFASSCGKKSKSDSDPAKDQIVAPSTSVAKGPETSPAQTPDSIPAQAQVVVPSQVPVPEVKDTPRPNPMDQGQMNSDYSHTGFNSVEYSVNPSGVTSPEVFYLVMFSYQDRINSIRSSHTFGTLAHGMRTGNGLAIDQSLTMSWLPRRMAIRPLWLFPETGHNFTLEQTLVHAQEENYLVKRWGPMPVSRELYAAAQRTFNFLNSGLALYVVADLAGRRDFYDLKPGSFSNCSNVWLNLTGWDDTGLMRGPTTVDYIYDKMKKQFYMPSGLAPQQWIPESEGVAAQLRVRQIQRQDL